MCDQILETMEDMLSDFQMDLGKISNEIQTLQDKSFSMNIQLKNRTVSFIFILFLKNQNHFYYYFNVYLIFLGIGE